MQDVKGVLNELLLAYRGELPVIMTLRYTDTLGLEISAPADLNR